MMRRLSRTRCPFWAILTVASLILVSAPAAAVAQTFTGAISGSVKDSSDSVVPGATVTVTNTRSGQSRTAVSGAGGEFIFAALQPGEYQLHAELSGFSKKSLTGVILAVNQRLEVPIRLDSWMREMKSLIALIAVASVAMGAGWQGPPDFSGQWIAEPEVVPPPAAPGTPGTPPGPPPRGSMGSGWGSPITISQDAKQLVVEHQMFSRYDLQPPLRYVYALDGTESQYPIMMSHTTQIRRSRAAWKGETLEIATSYPATDPGTGKSITVEVTQRLFLESPTTLVVEVTRASAFGGRPTMSRAVYKKG